MATQFLKMQNQTAELVDAIKAKRLNEDKVKDSKARVVADAVKLLADKELSNG